MGSAIKGEGDFEILGKERAFNSKAGRLFFYPQESEAPGRMDRPGSEIRLAGAAFLTNVPIFQGKNEKLSYHTCFVSTVS